MSREAPSYDPVPDDARRDGEWIRFKKDGRSYWRLALRERVELSDKVNGTQ